MLVEALAGIIFGVLTIVAARFIKGERWLYTLALITLPGIYIGFSLATGDSETAWKETIYGEPYFLAGAIFFFFNIRFSAVVISLLWIFHGLYDVFHTSFFVNPSVPTWYPVSCAATDLIVGAYLFKLALQLPKASIWGKSTSVST